ncbi:Atlastin [Pseudolycoriella hygida]|uniref:Atlastin n=1 Tax=Pseudolycoriella hygida TaxID=35572 RepID=A0A9Q0N271_9DIPT|nr:Atlastin [Pseudolycoriella hygida]
MQKTSILLFKYRFLILRTNTCFSNFQKYIVPQVTTTIRTKMQNFIFLLFFGALIGDQIQIAYSENATAVQIVHLENHSLRVDTKMLNEILGNENIKDRRVMIFSIAGPYRKGKSFFLNFALKYLHAQVGQIGFRKSGSSVDGWLLKQNHFPLKYVKHDISDWIGEDAVDGNNELHGFKWSGGQKQQTIGIWMWSEIFTHDFDNGDRVAIVLLDTQGIFDHESTTTDCTKTFAISIMVSSVQCYNVMQNVQENNLQDLDYFAAYGRLAIEQMNEKPFQKLLFLVRDWPYADEVDYGYAPKYVRLILSNNDKQSPAMHELRDRINLSFKKIEAFLMPYPGTAVAEGKNTNGDLRQMDSRFVQSVKEIVPSIFAPENLVVKQINGQKIRAYDLIAYIEKYAEIFNSNTLPEPKTALWATAETSLLLLQRDCLKVYVERMQEIMARRSDYENSVLLEHHQLARTEALSRFQKKKKLHFPDLVSSYQSQLDMDIAMKYKFYLELNKNRKADRLKIEELQRKSNKQRQYITDGTHQEGRGHVKNIAATGLGGVCVYLGWNVANFPYVVVACSVLGVAASVFGRLG